MNNSNGASLTNAAHVKNETELKNTINTATKPTTIALNKDITLTNSLTIPNDKNITLTSSRITGYYKLIGAADVSTITVNEGGVLKLEGIIVTHENGDEGRGIIIMENGQLAMHNGEISYNTANYWNYSGGGGGVYNCGNFSLYGGIISRNAATIRGSGGGVLNNGVFTMFGGEISYNTVYLSYSGGGVANGRDCTFIMFGGEISHNTATAGGGVTNGGTFTMSGGKISNNINTQSYSNAMSLGGGVYNSGDFTMSSGEITGNSANYGGGVYHSGIYDGVFKWLGGVISGNTAIQEGNDVHPKGSGGSPTDDGTVNGHGGVFSLETIVLICVCIVVVVGIVVTVLFFTSKKQLNPVENKIKRTDNSA